MIYFPTQQVSGCVCFFLIATCKLISPFEPVYLLLCFVINILKGIAWHIQHSVSRYLLPDPQVYQVYSLSSSLLQAIFMLIVLELHRTGSLFSASSSILLSDLPASCDYLVVSSLLMTHYLVLKSMPSF